MSRVLVILAHTKLCDSWFQSAIRVFVVSVQILAVSENNTAHRVRFLRPIGARIEPPSLAPQSTREGRIPSKGHSALYLD
jgi:hypothetical protein